MIHSKQPHGTFKISLPKLAKANDHRKIISLMKSCSVDVDQTNNEGRTALNVAARKGNILLAVILLLNGADVNRTSLWGISPLYEACSHGHAGLVTLFLLCGADPLLRAVSGLTPLHKAAENNHLAVIKIILSHPKVSVDCQSSFGSSPLISASHRSNTEAAKLLLQNGANAELRAANSNLTPLQVASLHSAWGVVSELLDAGASPNEKPGRHPSSLHLAVRNLSSKCVLLLIEAGASTGNVFGISLLKVLDNSPHKSMWPGQAKEIKYYLVNARSIRAGVLYKRRSPLLLLRYLVSKGRAVTTKENCCFARVAELPDVCFQNVILFL